MNTATRAQKYLDWLQEQETLTRTSKSLQHHREREIEMVNKARGLIQPILDRAIKSGDWSEVRHYLDEIGS